MVKKLLILSLALLPSVAALAQITHENSYIGAAEVTNIENNGYKYFVTDYINNSVAIYNEDHTPWKTVAFPLSQNQYLYDVSYVNSKVYNLDDLVEILLITYNYVSTSDTTGYYAYTTEVVNENGTVLLTVPGGGYAFTYTDSDSKNKLVVYVYDYSVSTYITSTEVYALPVKSSGINQNPGDAPLPYPNPASGNINLPYTLNQRSGNREMVISDTSGKEYSRKNVSAQEGLLNVNTSSLPAGTYFYRIESNGKSMPAGKFVVR